MQDAAREAQSASTQEMAVGALRAAHEQERRAARAALLADGLDSWEARSTPPEEGFWCFDSTQAAVERVAPQEQQS